jgi:hypothetical protein
MNMSHVSANNNLAIIRLDTIIGGNCTIYNMIQCDHQCWCKYSGASSCLEKSWRACVCVCVCVCVCAEGLICISIYAMLIEE